ncbi:MAG TPA: hypothetical protein VGF55_21915, partial [Gemmataceae bacterium]
MRRLAASLTVTLAGWAGVAAGQERTWKPAPAEPAVTLGPPTVALGPPRAARSEPVIRGQAPDDIHRVSQWVTALTEPDGGTVLPLQVPAPTVASATYTPPLDPPPPPPPPDPLLASAPVRSGVNDRKAGREHKSYFGEWFQGWGAGGPEGKCFESDHCFDYFISPVSNPFLFEDPRSLTEARPIFLMQTIPNSNPIYRGGNTEFFGSQFRLALTDQWSFVMTKLGGVWINPGSDSPFGSEVGLAELWLGPKWTFLRNTETGTVAAAGVTFQLPVGPDKVAQDTGKLSIVPYVTAAQNFGCTTYGSFNAMATLGYSFRADSDRSDYLFTSWHLDFDVGNQHRLYPLIELNWFHYSRSGGARPFDFEGRDLVNFGSAFVDGRNNLSLATGFRYKFSECVQTG